MARPDQLLGEYGQRHGTHRAFIGPEPATPENFSHIRNLCENFVL